MEKDLKLEKLCTEFDSLDAGDKDYILGIGKALAFSIEQQDLSSAKPDRVHQKQGGEPKRGKAV
jgi:hypothetical protein